MSESSRRQRVEDGPGAVHVSAVDIFTSYTRTQLDGTTDTNLHLITDDFDASSARCGMLTVLPVLAARVFVCLVTV